MTETPKLAKVKPTEKVRRLRSLQLKIESVEKDLDDLLYDAGYPKDEGGAQLTDALNSLTSARVKVFEGAAVIAFYVLLGQEGS